MNLLRLEGVSRETVQLVMDEFEANELELQELREARLNLTILSEELKAQDETMNEDRSRLLDALEAANEKLSGLGATVEFTRDDDEISSDAMRVLREFGRNPAVSQTFSTLNRSVDLPETALLEAVNELGMLRLVSLGTDMGHPDEFYLSTAGRNFLLAHAGRGRSALENAL